MTSDETNTGGLYSRLKKQHDDIIEQLENVDERNITEIEKVGESIADTYTEERFEISDGLAKDILVFFITIASEIEMESSLIINADVFDFGLRQEGSLPYIKEEFTQSDREDMLFYLGIIDSGLKGEMSQVRRKRNDLAHSNDHWIIEDVDREINKVERALKALKKIKKIGVQVEQELV